MESQGKNLKIIKWRCWEDAQSSFGSSLSGTVDIVILPSLRKLSLWLSFGNIGRDLAGLCDLLDATSQPMDELRALDISILFPNQPAPHRISNTHILVSISYSAWKACIVIFDTSLCVLRYVVNHGLGNATQRIRLLSSGSKSSMPSIVYRVFQPCSSVSVHA